MIPDKIRSAEYFLTHLLKLDFDIIRSLSSIDTVCHILEDTIPQTHVDAPCHQGSHERVS